MAVRLGRSARERVEAEFTVQKMQERVWQVYKDVARTKGLAGMFE